MAEKSLDLWQRDRLMGLTFCQAAMVQPKREFDPTRLYVAPAPKKTQEPLPTVSSSFGAQSKSTGALANRRRKEKKALEEKRRLQAEEQLLPGIGDCQKKLQAFASLARSQLQACDPEAADDIVRMFGNLADVQEGDVLSPRSPLAPEKSSAPGIQNCLAHLDRFSQGWEEAVKRHNEENEDGTGLDSTADAQSLSQSLKASSRKKDNV